MVSLYIACVVSMIKSRYVLKAYLYTTKGIFLLERFIFVQSKA